MKTTLSGLFIFGLLPDVCYWLSVDNCNPSVPTFSVSLSDSYWYLAEQAMVDVL